MSDVRQIAERLHASVADTPMTASADRRVRAALQAHATRGFRLGPRAVMIATATVALLVGWGLGRMTHPTPSPAFEAPAIALEPRSDPIDLCETRTEGDVIHLAGFCRHTIDRLAVETSDTAELRQHESGVRLLSGRATFDVEPVIEGPPVEVFVSEGRLQVLGTRFVVYQGPRGGHVDLIEGSIRFISDAGDTTTIAPGVRLRWGPMQRDASVADSPPESTTKPERAAPHREPRSRPRSVEASSTRGDTPVEVPLDRIAGLRAAGRYTDAVALIRGLDRSRLDVRTAEVLSYEEGSIVQDHLGDRQAACRHWAAHLQRFPKGRYRDQVVIRQGETCDE